MQKTFGEWEVVIGLEVHVQLATQSKIFSTAGTTFGLVPNANIVELDVAMPGTLPVLNRVAVEKAICFGLTVGAQINRKSIFARKNYFYPDLPKGYQISQFELPILEYGSLSVRVESDGGYDKVVRLTRAHLEEDAGKLLHEGFLGLSGIDLNRAGMPLLEIVSEPDMRSAAEAVAYARALHRMVTWIGLSDGNMQEGSLRFDANVSVRPRGQQTLGTRREIKNLNSFRFLEQAIGYEMGWQIEELESGRSIEQATVLFDSDSGQTRTMRVKENAHDYRYFPDPDLPPLIIGEDWIKRVRDKMLELPDAMRVRFESQYGLSAYDATTLTTTRAMAAYFEATVALGTDSKLASNWIIGEISAQLNREEKEIHDCPVAPKRLALMIQRIQDHTINHQSAKMILRSMWESQKTADELIAEYGLEQETDTGAIESMIDDVLRAHPNIFAEYKSGKEKAFNSLIGQCMKAARGKAPPTLISELLRKKVHGQ